jgi:hypothetical protein
MSDTKIATSFRVSPTALPACPSGRSGEVSEMKLAQEPDFVARLGHDCTSMLHLEGCAEAGVHPVFGC